LAPFVSFSFFFFNALFRVRCRPLLPYCHFFSLKISILPAFCTVRPLSKGPPGSAHVISEGLDTSTAASHCKLDPLRKSTISLFELPPRCLCRSLFQPQFHVNCTKWRRFKSSLSSRTVCNSFWRGSLPPKTQAWSFRRTSDISCVDSFVSFQMIEGE